MNLYGKEIGFRRSIWAENELKKAAPDGKVGAFLQRMGDPDPFEAMDSICTFCMIMHNADEKWKAFNAAQTGKKYEPVIWGREAWENLTEQELNEAASEALNVWTGDAKQEVEVKPAGKNAEGQSKAKS